jgi:FkbM family methyltransferase
MKFANIPRTLRSSVQIARLLTNWPEVVVKPRLGKSKPDRLRFRNGVVLQGPEAAVVDFLFREIWCDQVYGPPGYQIQRGDTVIDVGANVGFFATFAATRASDVKVYSFEPFASNFGWLRKNVEDSGLTNIDIFQQAVAGSSGPRPFFIEPTNCMFHSLFCDEAVDGSKRQYEMVECTTLDEIFRVHRIECCHVLKLDCEGAEFDILSNSSPEALNRIRKVVGERHVNCSPEALCGFLESHSFHIDCCRPDFFCARNTAPLQS